MYKKILLILITIIITGMTGCGVDIDKRNLVVGIGIDQGEHARYRVTLKIASVQSNPNEPGNNFFILSEEANSIAHAVEGMQAKSERLLDFSQMKVILMGEEIALKNVKNLLDYILRNPSVQMIAWMAVARPSAQAVLQIKEEVQRPIDVYLYEEFTNMEQQSIYMMPVPLSEFYFKFGEKGVDAYLPIIEGKEDNIVVNRLAIFDKSGMRLELQKEEVMFFKLLTNNQRKLFHFDFQTKEGKEHIVTEFRKPNVKYKLEGNTRPPKIKFHLQLTGKLEEVVDKNLPMDLTTYETQESQEIKEKIINLLQKLQRKDLDPIGFGLHYLAKNWNPKSDWEKWEELKSNLMFEVTVHVKLRSDGLLKD